MKRHPIQDLNLLGGQNILKNSNVNEQMLLCCFFVMVHRVIHTLAIGSHSRPKRMPKERLCQFIERYNFMNGIIDAIVLCTTLLILPTNKIHRTTTSTQENQTSFNGYTSFSRAKRCIKIQNVSPISNKKPIYQGRMHTLEVFDNFICQSEMLLPR